ncbi:hypothetical protein [Arthrobacter silvisoli]|uniref:hypothetical protein n=1 Tax=Arthrobacter silvisoli TaxID=2291022 RepID=UPI00109BF236|nr:hypothetical protein [Arthrobacter silvisoli]
MRKRMWGFGILGAGAVAALVAATIPPATPDPSDLPSMAPDYAAVEPAAQPEPGILDKARSYVDESEAAFAARMVVTAGCMAKAGFPDFKKTELSHREPNLNSFIYGFAPMDVATARKSGYPHLKGREIYMPEPMIEAFNGSAESQKVVRVGAKGFVVGGCKLEGIEATYGTGQDYAQAADAYSLVFPAVETARHAPAASTALGDWSVCMTEAGYEDLKDPGKGSLLAAQQGGQAARKMAVADATCREQTQLEKRLQEVAAPYLTTVVAQQQRKLDEVADIRAAAETRAAALLKK